MLAHEKLKKWRKKEELTLGGAAAKLGVTATTWFDWERGEKSPKVHHALALEKLTEGAVKVVEFAKASRAKSEARKALSTGTDDE